MSSDGRPTYGARELLPCHLDRHPCHARRGTPAEPSFERADAAEAGLDIVENETLIGRAVGVDGRDRSTAPTVGAAASGRGGAHQRSARSSVEFR
jgi:hypothetical protein